MTHPKKFLKFSFTIGAIFLLAACEQANIESGIVDDSMGEEIVKKNRSTAEMIGVTTIEPGNTAAIIKDFELMENSVSLETEALLNDFIVQQGGTSVFNVKAYQEIENESADKEIILFGVNCKNVEEQFACNKAIKGFFIVDQDKIIGNYILKGDLNHMRLQNIKWGSKNTVSFEILKLFGNPNTGEGNFIENWQMFVET